MKTLLTVIFCLAMAGMAMAETKQVTATFEYHEIPADNIVQPKAWQLYKNGVFVCEELDITLREFTCSVNFNALDVNEIDPTKAGADFTLTAVDNRDIESDASNIYPATFAISDLPSLDAPTSLNAVIEP